jgi:enoyl-CoA hydratase/carnithine racemase
VKKPSKLLRTLINANVPVDAAVEGWAGGLGVGLVGASKFAVASQDARFKLPEARSGYLPLQVLPFLTRAPAEQLRWALMLTRFLGHLIARETV